MKMGYLLDTQIFLWWLNDDKKLGEKIKKIIANPQNLVFLSVASAWEIILKLKTKKLRLKTSPRKCFENLEFELLDIKLNHVLESHKLPYHHKDPFDRMLIAQARVEKLSLITSDTKIWQYKAPLVKVK